MLKSTIEMCLKYPNIAWIGYHCFTYTLKTYLWYPYYNYLNEHMLANRRNNDFDNFFSQPQQQQPMISPRNQPLAPVNHNYRTTSPLKQMQAQLSQDRPQYTSHNTALPTESTTTENQWSAPHDPPAVNRWTLANLKIESPWINPKVLSVQTKTTQTKKQNTSSISKTKQCITAKNVQPKQPAKASS